MPRDAPNPIMKPRTPCAARGLTRLGQQLSALGSQERLHVRMDAQIGPKKRAYRNYFQIPLPGHGQTGFDQVGANASASEGFRDTSVRERYGVGI
jgi:hypothetical protein